MSFSASAHAADNLQVDDMRGELLRVRKDKTELQRARLETFQPTVQPHGDHTDREEGRGGLRGSGIIIRSGLEAKGTDRTEERI